MLSCSVFADPTQPAAKTGTMPTMPPFFWASLFLGGELTGEADSTVGKNLQNTIYHRSGSPFDIGRDACGDGETHIPRPRAGTFWVRIPSLHRHAGASVVGILSPQLNAVFFEPDAPHDSSDRYETLEPMFRECDLVLVEGHSQVAAPKVEVWRAASCFPPLARGDSSVLAW